MSQLSWGNPTIEIGKCGADGAAPTTWTKIPYPLVQDSAKLTPTKGDKQEANTEDGDPESVRYGKNKYTFEYEIRQAKGRTKPIADNDGIVNGEYAMRLTPEDSDVPGIIIDRTNVSVEDSWDVKNGLKWKFTHDVLKPASGNKVKEYNPNLILSVTPSSLSLTKAADATGKNINVSQSGGITSVSSSQSWCSVSASDGIVSVKVTANDTGSDRSAAIVIVADGKTATVQVTQAGA